MMQIFLLFWGTVKLALENLKFVLILIQSKKKIYHAQIVRRVFIDEYVLKDIQENLKTIVVEQTRMRRLDRNSRRGYRRFIKSLSDFSIVANFFIFVKELFSALTKLKEIFLSLKVRSIVLSSKTQLSFMTSIDFEKFEIQSKIKLFFQQIG